MGKNNLKLKDLVTLGVFSAIYFVGMFVVGMPLGFSVVAFLFYPLACAIISGVITMFFMAKVQKPWALFIFGLIPGLIMTLMGHTPVVAIHSAIIALIAEFVRRSFGFKSIKGNIITHSVLSMWLVGSFLQIFLMQDVYYKLTEKMAGAEYASELIALPLWIVPVLYISAFIGGLIGGKFGAKVLNKHFKKAGLA